MVAVVAEVPTDGSRPLGEVEDGLEEVRMACLLSLHLDLLEALTDGHIEQLLHELATDTDSAVFRCDDGDDSRRRDSIHAKKLPGLTALNGARLEKHSKRNHSRSGRSRDLEASFDHHTVATTEHLGHAVAGKLRIPDAPRFPVLENEVDRGLTRSNRTEDDGKTIDTHAGMTLTHETCLLKVDYQARGR